MSLKTLRLKAVKAALIGFSWLVPAKYALPVKWLKHYAVGSGKTLLIPAWVISQAEDSFYLAQERGYCDKENIFLHSSTLYDGVGFQNRPVLFYLVGGCTGRLCQGRLILTDRYDWHPTKEGKYFTSGLGFSPKVDKVLHFLLGEEYYPLQGFPMGHPGISNQLWADLVEVGAKPFISRGSIPFKIEEVLVEREVTPRSYKSSYPEDDNGDVAVFATSQCPWEDEDLFNEE